MSPRGLNALRNLLAKTIFARPKKSHDLIRAANLRERKENALRMAQKKARASAKDVVGAIGYDLMYKDGIAQVEKGLFSETIAFDDISYQSARREGQEAVFSVMSEIYDYFGPDTRVQLSIINTPIPPSEIGCKEFFSGGDAHTHEYVKEYNRILNNKMREGVSNLTRERYLTYMVSAKDVESAVPKLARARTDIVASLARIRATAHVLDGAERLRLLQSQLRPNSAFEFTWDALPLSSRLHTKDLIAPQVLDFSPDGRADCFVSDGTYCQILWLRAFGSDLDDRCLARIIDLPIPLNVTLHVFPMDKSDAEDFVKERIVWMDKEIVDEDASAVRKGYGRSILPPELIHSKEEAEDLLDQIQNKNQRLFGYAGLIFLYAKSETELADRAEQVVSVARQRSIEVEPLYYRQRKGLNSILPLGNCHIDPTRFFTTAQIAIQMPFATQELAQRGGGYYGQNKLSGNLVLCNRSTLASPMGFVCGKPGSGKSFSVKREIMNTILAYPKDEIIIFDPAGEYSAMVKAAGGVVARLAADADTHINPFDLSDVAHLSATSQMAFKIDALLALSSATMAEGREGLSEADKSIIARAVEISYERTQSDERLPILGDFYKVLCEQPETEARNIALRYERYTRGALSFFNHPSNVRFENRITCVDFHDLNTHMKVFGMLTALEAVRNRMYANFDRGVRTWLYIDEVQSLFGHASIISYFSKFWAEGRKFGLVATGITQNSTYMLDHEEARTMVLNSDFILLHKQSALDRKCWVDLLGLSAVEAEYIGDGIKAGEGLLVAGGAHIPIKDDFPKGLLYDLFNTKPDDEGSMWGKRKRQAKGKGALSRV